MADTNEEVSQQPAGTECFGTNPNIKEFEKPPLGFWRTEGSNGANSNNSKQQERKHKECTRRRSYSIRACRESRNPFPNTLLLSVTRVFHRGTAAATASTATTSACTHQASRTYPHSNMCNYRIKSKKWKLKAKNGGKRMNQDDCLRDRTLLFDWFYEYCYLVS